MPALADLATALAALGQTFPQYVWHEIARLTDEFVGSVKSFTNPLTLLHSAMEARVRSMRSW
jgi:hypothetical protein